MDEKHPELWMLAAGLLTGFGQLLASDQKLTWRIVIGRAISSAALGGAGGTALLFFPDMPFPALVGIACAFASLGTSGLERILQKFLGIK